jgi:hypothetical protein
MSNAPRPLSANLIEIAIILAMRTSVVRAAVWYAVLSGCGGSSGQGTETGPDGGSQGGGGTAQSAPIPTTSFVYESDPVKDQFQIFAYDPATAGATKVADLTGAVSIDGLALSRDRTSVLFTGLFRPELSETQLGYLADSAWTVQTDGTTFRRVTRPLPAMTPPGPLFTIGMLQPAWSRDGATVYFQFSEVWGNVPMHTGAGAIWQVAASGGLPGPAPGLSSACIAGSLAFSPDGSMSAFLGQFCASRDNDGVYLVRGGTVTRLVGFAPSLRDTVHGLTWTADGSVMIGDANGLDVIAVPSGQVTATIALPVTGASIDEIAADPAGRYVAACVRLPGSVTSLGLLDLSKSPPAWARLQVPLGSRCHVSW